ncbi:MAG: peptidase M22, partial [Oscillospiraceae bacterium]
MSYRALGIDTSNYTTSAALYCDGRVTQSKRLLPVAPGQLGLRQSEAVFAHVKALGDVAGTLLRGEGHVPNSVGVSCAPRNVEGSYMPCFLTGVMAAEVSAAALGVPLHRFSHQQGHIAAALYGAAQLNWMTERFVAFHLSGGTTECVLIESLAQGRMTLISKTNDLNAGQVVDRVGHMLGLSFPAGAALDTLARQSERSFQIRPTMMGGNPCLSGVENQCADRVKRGESPADVANFCIQSILAALSG